MLITEFFGYTWRDHVRLFRTFSDEGFFIERDGVMYQDAIEPEDNMHEYTETDVKIPIEEEEEGELDA